MTVLSDVISVALNISTLRPVFPGFGIPLIIGKFATWTTGGTVERFRQYTSLQALQVDFPQVSGAGFSNDSISDRVEKSKIFLAAQAAFSQVRNVQYIYIGRFDSAAPDASFTAAYSAIRLVLNDFYGVVITSKQQSDIQNLAPTVEADGKIFGSSSEDSGVPTSGTTDTAYILQQAGYNRSFYTWHYRAGTDFTSAGSAAVVTGSAPNFTVVITQNNHVMRVGDLIVVYGASVKPQINGIWTITAVTANTITYQVSSITLTAGTETSAITCYSRYDFLESSWLGDLLPTTPGQYNWGFANLIGQLPSSSGLNSTFLSEAQELLVLGKNANVYTGLGNVNGTRKGTMASGRFIDTQIGVDWLTANLQQSIYTALINLPKIPYTDAGMAVIYGAIDSVMRQAINNGILAPLIPPASNSGELYRIVIPKIAAQTQANRLSRIVSGIAITGQMAGAVNQVSITVNASF